MLTKKKGQPALKLDHPFLHAIMNCNPVVMDSTIKNLANFLMTTNEIKVIKWR